ncbi:helicase HerA-like domain-containing protein [Xanthobacteraceae bacterium A53D]
MTPDKAGTVFVGRSPQAAKDENLVLRLANRHGLVTGATGTGKTVTLQVLAEGFARAGVPVFCADVKGDLSGIAMQGEPKDFLLKRAQEVGLTYTLDSFPVIFWDLFGEKGHPVRTTISEMGPLLLSRLMDLNEVQEGVLNIAFRLADEQGLALLDLKDLRATLAFVAENAKTLTKDYGNVSAATVGAIQRQLLVLETQGGDAFFGEPALEIDDLMRVERSGYGTISVLAADKLMASPRLYATFLLWLLSELFEQMPEVGDLEKPKLVFFFDEAHLLFDSAPKVLLEKVEQVVRLIRSKGVGVYFVTQNPLDVPDKVLSQLGNRVQHALRAFTPRDQKAVKAAAETFRPNPNLDTARVISEMGKGEALVSLLEGSGTPTMVERVLIAPPSARVGAITDAERAGVMQQSPVRGRYDKVLDRESAFEVLRRRQDGGAAPSEPARRAPEPEAPREGPTREGPWGRPPAEDRFPVPPPAPQEERSRSVPRVPRTGSTRMSTTEVVVRQVARSLASQVGNQLGKAILRGILGGRSR